MTAGIYRIFNISSNKSYVGSSINIERRWKGHIASLKRGAHRNRHLQRSFDMHGIDSFSFSILEVAKRDIILEREKYWMEKYDVNNPDCGYNIYENPLKPGYRKGDVPSEIRDKYGIDRLVSFVSPEGKIYRDIKNVTRFSQEHGLSATNMNLLASGVAGKHMGWTKLGNTIDFSLGEVRKRRPGKFDIYLINENDKIFHVTNLQKFCEENKFKYTAIHNLIHGICKKSCGFRLHTITS